MEILGLVFAGSATDRRPEMARFVADFPGPEPAPTRRRERGHARTARRTFCAVACLREMGETSRTIELVEER